MDSRSKADRSALRGKFNRRFAEAVTLADAAQQLRTSQDGETADLPAKIVDADLWRPEGAA